MTSAARRALRGALLALSALATGCAEPAPERSPQPFVVLVLVDGVDGIGCAKDWATALGPNAWSSAAGAVSTSAAATLASVLTGLEPAEHGRFSARDFGVELGGASFVEELADAAKPRFEVRVAASVRRELAPELVDLGGGFVSWLAVRPGELGAALDALTPHFTAALTEGDGVFALAIESVPERPVGRWPVGLAQDLERELSPLLTDDHEPPAFDRYDLWFERAWLADAAIGPALTRAWHSAHQRSLCERIGALVAQLESRRDDWCVVVSGLRPAGLHLVDGASALVPIAARSSHSPLEPVGELVDLGAAVARRCGLVRVAPRSEQELFGLWSGDGGLRGARGAWVETTGVWAGRMAEPPPIGIAFELGIDAAPVRVALTADRPLFVGDASGRVLASTTFDLAPGERRTVPFDSATPRLLIELSADGSALAESVLFVDGAPLDRARLPRVLDGRGHVLAKEELEGHFVLEEPERGTRALRNAVAAPIVHTWPPSDDPIAVEEVRVDGETQWRFDVRSSTRLAVLATLGDREPSAGPVTDRDQIVFAAPGDFVIDGRANEPSALRLLWPAVPASKSLAADGGAPTSSSLRLDTIGRVAPLGHVPPHLRGLVKSLRPWE